MKKTFAAAAFVALFCGGVFADCGECDKTLKPGWWEGDDFAWIRGANYVPSYASNDIEQWREYEPETIERELALAESLRLNSLRVWLQYLAYELDPAGFMKNYEDFLTRCARHNIRPMIIVFDGCFGADPEPDSKNWVASPGPRRMVKDYRPKLKKYVDDVVGKYKGDPRILFWDVMNEPSSLGLPPQANGDVEFAWDFAREFAEYIGEIDGTHPRTIGVGHHSHIPHVLNVSDVVTYHNYQSFAKAFEMEISAARKLAGNKAVVITETTPCAWGQDPHMSFRVFREKKIGWYFWHFVFGELNLTQYSLVTTDAVTPYPDYVAAMLGLTVAKEAIPDRFTGWTIYRVARKSLTVPTTADTYDKRSNVLRHLARCLGWSGALKGEDAQEVVERAMKVETLYKEGDKVQAFELMDECLAFLYESARKAGFFEEYGKP